MSDQSILSKYTRQPKIYIGLPSKGKFYKNNPFEKTSTGELPVFSMTAKDEMILKTPDALMNGESVAMVIKSCVPLIVDVSEIPVIDLDYILVATRIATYGEKMKISVPVEGKGLEEPEDLEVEIDLRTVLDELNGHEWENEFVYGDLKFQSKPLTLHDQNIQEINQFETSRLINAVRNTELPEEERNKIVKESFHRITDSNLNLVHKQIVAIETPEGVESNPTAIKAFFDNADKKMFSAVFDYLTEQRDKFAVKPRKISVPQQLVEQGAPEEISTPLIFNQSNFFE